MRDLGIREGQALTVALPPELLRVFDDGAERGRMSLAAAALPARRRLAAEEIVMRAAIVALVAFLLLAIALPLATLLSKSFQDGDGRFVGLANYARYFATPTLVASLWNSIWVAALSTAIVVPLAFVYAYALTRTRMPAKPAVHGAGAAAAVRAVAAVGHLAHLHLRQPGLPEELADGRQRSTGRSASCWRRCSIASRTR